MITELPQNIKEVLTKSNVEYEIEQTKNEKFINIKLSFKSSLVLIHDIVLTVPQINVEKIASSMVERLYDICNKFSNEEITKRATELNINLDIPIEEAKDDLYRLKEYILDVRNQIAICI